MAATKVTKLSEIVKGFATQTEIGANFLFVKVRHHYDIRLIETGLNDYLV